MTKLERLRKDEEVSFRWLQGRMKQLDAGKVVQEEDVDSLIRWWLISSTLEANEEIGLLDL